MSKKMRYLCLLIVILVASNVLNEFISNSNVYHFRSKDGAFKRLYLPAKGNWDNVILIKEHFESRKDTSMVIYRLEKINIFRFWKWKEYCFNPEWKPTHIDNAE